MTGPSRAKKRLGQHFLTAPALLDRIAAAVPAEPGESVVEIGPGRGALTRALVARGFRVTAIEKDDDLLPTLREQFPGVRIAAADAVTADWAALAGADRTAMHVVGNIPYHVTSPLLDAALTPPRPRSVVFLVQREVAERLRAHPGTKDYGALTVGVQAVAVVEVLFGVGAGAFTPRPQVDSAVVRLRPRRVPLVADEEIGGFRRFVVALFGARRKQLSRALRQMTGRSAEEIAGVLAAAGVEPTQRPETVGVEGMVRLYRRVVDGEPVGG